MVDGGGWVVVFMVVVVAFRVYVALGDGFSCVAFRKCFSEETCVCKSLFY